VGSYIDISEAPENEEMSVAWGHPPEEGQAVPEYGKAMRRGSQWYARDRNEFAARFG